MRIFIGGAYTVENHDVKNTEQVERRHELPSAQACQADSRDYFH